MNRQMLPSIFIVLPLAAALVSCGDAPASATETTAVTSAQPETTDDANVLKSSEILPDADFGGAEYHILSREYAKLGDLPSYEFVVDAENGDLINDTIYKRCSIVEEQYNVTITAVQFSNEEAVTNLQNSQMAGDCAYHLVWSHIGSMTQMVSNGLLSNYYDIPHIDITQPWWNQLATDSLTVNDRCYLQMNYIPFTGMMLSHCLYFNKNMAQDYDIDNLYAHVDDNTWTFDTFASYVKQVSGDVNGDGTFDQNDIFGLLSSHGTSGIAFSIAMNVKALALDDSGSFSLCISSDRNQSILDKISDLVETDSSYMITDYALENDLARMFAADKGLFYSGFLTDSYQFFRDMNSDFGLLPFPKYDQTQKQYITTITGGTGLLGIPLILDDPDMTGLVTEALAIESYQYVYPAIYETVFENKLIRDEESQRMFDILMSGMEIDFGRTFKYGDYVDLFGNLLVKKSRDLASSAEKLRKSAQKHYETIIALYYE